MSQALGSRGATLRPALAGALRGLRGRSLAARLIVPVSLLFLTFSVLLGFLVAAAVRGIYLGEATGRAGTLGKAAGACLEAEWERASFAISNPVTQRRFSPLLSGGNVDAVTRALRELRQAAKASFLHAYDAQGAFLTSSEEAAASVELAALTTLTATLEKRPGRVAYVTLTDEILRFEGIDPARLQRPQGKTLAAAASLPLKDDFGDRIGSLLFVRVLSGADDFAAEVGRTVGGEVSLALNGVAVATTVPSKGGRPAAGHPVSAGGAADALTRIDGAAYQGHYQPLPGALPGTAAGVWTAVPVSAMIHKARVLSVQVLLAAFGAAAAFAILVAALTRRSLRHVPPLLAHMEQVSRGRLLRVGAVETGDEMEALARGLDRTVASLRGLVGQVKSSFEQVEALAGGLAQTAESLAEGNRTEGESLAALESTAETLAQVVSTVGAEASASDQTARQNLETLRRQLGYLRALADDAGRVVAAADHTQQALADMAVGQHQAMGSLSSLTSRLTESAAAMQEIDLAIREIRDLTGTTRDVAVRLAAEASGRGQGAMERVSAELSNTGALVTTLVGSVQTLGQRSEEIGDIIGIITGVTSQSKLLALNASILAAQAGEHGRAFGVVADNIRMLSESTSDSARTIVHLIETMQEESRRVVAETARGVQALERSNQEVGNLHDALRSIIAGTEETSRLAERMAAFTDSQSTASSRVASSIAWIASTAQQLSATAAQQAASGQHLVGFAEDTRRRATDMKRLADEQADGLGLVALTLEETVQGAERLLASAGSTDQSAQVLREVVSVIRGVSDENRGRVAAVKASVSQLTKEATQVGRSLSAFSLE